MATPSASNDSRASSAQPTSNLTLPPGVTGTAFQPRPSNNTSDPNGGPAATSLDRLQPMPETIECPHCKRTTQTRVVGRSKGKERFMNVFWWPLPGRRHWWEKTEWFCAECDRELATQKYGKDLVVVGQTQ